MNKVLVIDDERGPRESLRILLKPKYEVFCAENLEQALTLLEVYEPDAIFLDIKMPNTDGIQVLKHIRQKNPYVSVVMLTGFGSLETAQEAIRLGANDYLKKPFDVREIELVVHRCCQRTQFLQRREKAIGELKELNQKLSDESSKKEKMATLGQKSAELIHDMNTPLNVILGYTYMLFKKLEGLEQGASDRMAEALGFIEIIETNVKRCSELANTWRSLGQDQSGSPQPFSLHELLEEISDNSKSLASSAGVTFESQIGLSPDKCVLADKLQLLRALQNVVSNAIQSMEGKPGTVKLTVSTGDDQCAYISVEDTGCGIPANLLCRIFDPYFTTKVPGKGTGLGLFITKKIIESVQGDIVVKSTEGEGTHMRIRLPLITSPVEECVGKSKWEEEGQPLLQSA